MAFGSGEQRDDRSLQPTRDSKELGYVSSPGATCERTRKTSAETSKLPAAATASDNGRSAGMLEWIRLAARRWRRRW